MFIFSILTGCFGASSIILSIIKKTKLRPQKITKKLAISKIDAIKFSLKGTILGNFVAGLPGLSCAHVSFLVRPKSGLMLLMVVLGAINTSALISGLVILFFLGKKRSGLAIAISTLASTLDPNLFIFFIVIILGATFYAIFICDFLNTQIPKILQNLNYVWLSAGNLLFIIILVILLGGSEALIFLVLATSLGISCYYLQVKRVYCMCFLFIPVLLHYLIGIDLWSMS
jgi:TctA family transporter